MNAGLDATHVSVHYDDADYPSLDLTAYPENVDATVHSQGIADSEVAERVQLVEQDVTRLDLSNRDYRLVIITFNSLLCITDFNEQRQALRKVPNTCFQAECSCLIS